MEVETFPSFPFYKVDAIIRPWRLPYVTAALEKKGFRGLTAYEVKGIGFQDNANVERNHGTEFGKDTLVEKVKIEIVVVKKQVQEVIDIVSESSHTGEVGDGKIFVSPVLEVVRIRTGESGLAAERMQGGAEDMGGDSASEILSSRF